MTFKTKLHNVPMDKVILFNPKLYNKNKKFRKDIERLFKSLKLRLIHKEKYLYALNIIVSNLYELIDFRDTHCIMISLNKNYYREYKISYNIAINILQQLHNLDFISIVKGVFKKENKIRSRIYLLKLPELVNKTYRRSYKMEASCNIILKDKNKEVIRFQSNKNIKKINKNVKKLNNTLNKHNITIDGKRLPIQHIVRIYNNNSFEQGGRFYRGLFQNIKKELRKTIKINNEETCELDYSCLHINLLYGMKGIQWNGDAYDLPEYKSDRFRKFIKKAINTIINSPNEKTALRSIQYGINMKQFPRANLNKLFDLIKNKHSKISELIFNTDIGPQLQNIESNIAAEVIENYINDTQNPILPIHDGFIVVKKDMEILKKIMFKAYFDRFHLEIEIKEK